MHVLVDLAKPNYEILFVSFWGYLMMLVCLLNLAFRLLLALKFGIGLLELDVLHADVDHRL